MYQCATKSVAKWMEPPLNDRQDTVHPARPLLVHIRAILSSPFAPNCTDAPGYLWRYRITLLTPISALSVGLDMCWERKWPRMMLARLSKFQLQPNAHSHAHPLGPLAGGAPIFSPPYLETCITNLLEDCTDKCKYLQTTRWAQSWKGCESSLWAHPSTN